MLCPSAPINPRSGAASECTAFEPACPRLWAEESCNDVEQRAGPVSRSSDPQASRSPVAASRRLRPRVSAGAPQQRPSAGSAFSWQRPAVEPLRFRDPQAGGQSGGAQSRATPTAGDPAPATAAGRLRRGDLGAARSGAEQLLRAEAGSRDADATRAPARPTGLASRLALALIGVYQRTISPNLGNLCRYEPTCSHYAYESIERHGLVKGGWLALKRLSRCRPLGGRGYDPVPD